MAYPSAPAPGASPGQVEKFFKQCFLAHRTESSETVAGEEASRLAVKLRINGNGLYRLSKESLVGTVGAEGEVIYSIIPSGQYGYVS